MEENKFKRNINSRDLIYLAFGAMIGWGWVVASGGWIESAGVLGTVLGFIIGGLMIYFVGLTYAELTTAMPRSGGEHVFSYRAFGPKGSYMCTWAIILSYVGVVCFEACSLPTIIQYIYPDFLQGYLYTIAGFKVYASWLAVAVICAMLITYVNILGVKAAAKLQRILTTIIAVVGLILVSVSAINGDSDNLMPQLFEGNDGSGIIRNILSVAVIAPFFLFGFDVIPQAAEEINVPLKKIGRILILSIILAVGFYAMIVLAIGYALNSHEIATSMQESGLVAADAMAKMCNSSTMAKVLIVGGMCGIMTTWNSFLIGGSRAIFSLGEAYMIPPIFGKLHPKYKTPANALYLIGFISALSPLCGRIMLVWVSNVASLACCVAYCMVSVAFIVLRRNDWEMHRPYKVKHNRIVGMLAVLLTGMMIVLYLIPGTGCTLNHQEFAIAIGWVVLGIVFGVYSQIKYKKIRRANNTLEKAPNRISWLPFLK